MNREFNSTEKFLILLLTLILLCLVYYKFVLTPINDEVARYETSAAEESAEIDSMMTKVTEMKKMQAQLEDIKVDGEKHAIPVYNDGRKLMNELKGILDSSISYSLTFGDISREELVTGDTLVSRPATIVFTAQNYAQARKIINAVHTSENAKSVSDIDIQIIDVDGVGLTEVTMNVVYFEAELKE